MQAYRRPLEDYTSSPYDDIVVDDNWDSQRINHEIIKRADVVADKRPKYINKSSRSKTTTAPSTAAHSDAHRDPTKATGHVPVYRIRGKGKNATQRSSIDTTTVHSISTSTHRNKHRKTFQLKPRQILPKNSSANVTERVASAVGSSRPAVTFPVATTEANVAPSSPSTTNHRHTLSEETPTDVATRRTPNGRRYRIRVIEASSVIGKGAEISTEPPRPSTTIAPVVNVTDTNSSEEPNYPAAFKGYICVFISSTTTVIESDFRE